jgi:hypothetical protein
MREAPAPGRHREEREARRGDPEGDGRRPMIPGLLRFARNDGGSDARDLTQAQRFWRKTVWDLKIVAGRILALKSIEPDAKVWRIVTEGLADLDGWAVADNLASVGSR